MGTKNDPGQYDCYAKAEPDEPMFILLGRDPNAPAAVRKWADSRNRMINAGEKPDSDKAIVQEALALADEMERWHRLREFLRNAKNSPFAPKAVETP